MRSINVVGIDPAMRNFGFAKATLDIDTLEYKIDDLILARSENEAGKTVRKNSDDLRRARGQFEAMREACKGAAFAIVEIPVGSQSARAMASYGICVGILAGCDIPIIEVTATEVKLAGAGSKTASKDEQIKWAHAKFPDAPWLYRNFKGKRELIGDNEHLADAIAAIEAGIYSRQLQQAISVYKAVATQ